MKRLSKHSLGVGDRFAHQAKAQLQACALAEARGAVVVPVWNKSNREHLAIGSEPVAVREAAEAAVAALGWKHPHHVDADHVRLGTVDRFLAPSDFFTLDVADAIGKAAPEAEIDAFAGRHPELVGRLEIPGVAPLSIAEEDVRATARQFLGAVAEAGRLYRHVADAKGTDAFVTEVSMDETERPQTPPELLVILAALADEGIPLQTIAPKFTGRFNKGVDYVGEVARFEREFSDDLAVVAFAVARYGLPATLKLSVHSGSDKFSIYAPIRRALARFDAGVHVKTAGTTWLEELIGLAEAGGGGLAMAKGLYAKALAKREALCAPYAAVIDVDVAALPSAAEVDSWSSEAYVAALRHDRADPAFNPSLRQLMHVAYKLAADEGDRYLGLLRENEAVVARNVTHNLFERHIRPLFLDDPVPPGERGTGAGE